MIAKKQISIHLKFFIFSLKVCTEKQLINYKLTMVLIMKSSKNIKSREKHYKNFTTPLQIEKWAEQYYLDWSDDFKKAHKNKNALDYLKFYFGETYKNINFRLRSGNLRENELNTIRDCIRIIKAAPKIPENIIVYRAVGKDFFRNARINSFKFFEKGFMSTSLLEGAVIDKNKGRYTPYQSCKYILKIHINKETEAVYSEFIKSNFGGPSNEYEILFPPNILIKLIKLPYYNFKLHRWIFTSKIL